MSDQRPLPQQDIEKERRAESRRENSDRHFGAGVGDDELYMVSAPIELSIARRGRPMPAAAGDGRGRSPAATDAAPRCYRLEAGDARRNVNDTGTGNTLNLSHPRVLQMVMESLRDWG